MNKSNSLTREQVYSRLTAINAILSKAMYGDGSDSKLIDEVFKDYKSLCKKYPEEVRNFEASLLLEGIVSDSTVPAPKCAAKGFIDFNKLPLDLRVFLGLPDLRAYAMDGN